VPLEDLPRFGVGEADLLGDRPTRAVRRLIGHLVDRTRALFELGERLPEAFSGQPAAVLRLFQRGGLAILDEIEARPQEILRGRIRVPRAKALLLLAAEEVRLRASALDGTGPR
jgi:phytoene synthase